MVSRFLVLLAATSALAACKPAPTTEPANDAAATETRAASTDPIKNALSALPASLAADAAVVAPQPDGSMKQLREGKNGWTCMPDSPTTPGPDPMCMDANALQWATAWMGHKTPPPGVVGLMYMLEGGTDASNTDPYATAPTAGNDWVKTGPHLMVVGAPSLNASYKGEAKPDTGQPYVMWGGTPYAHLMIPIR